MRTHFVVRKNRRPRPPFYALPSNSLRPRGEGRPMKAVRLFVIALLVGGLALAAACGDRTPTTPQPPAPSGSLLGSLLGPTGLLKCSNLPYDSTTQTIGIAGGSLSVGPHTLVIPPGALSKPTAITMVLPTDLG